MTRAPVTAAQLRRELAHIEADLARCDVPEWARLLETRIAFLREQVGEMEGQE